MQPRPHGPKADKYQIIGPSFRHQACRWGIFECDDNRERWLLLRQGRSGVKVNMDPQETSPERPNQAAIDSLMPAEMAQKAERVGEAKADLDMPRLFCRLV